MFEKILVDKNNNKDAFSQIMGQIIDCISNGELKSGDALPAERAMAETFGVSRPIVREVIKSLEFLGIVSAVQGGANYISMDLKNCFIEPIAILMKISQTSPRQSQQLRVTLECAAARLAAINSTPVECAKLNLLMEQVNATEDVDDAKDMDFKFHLQIAKMADNPIIYSVLAASVSITEDLISNTRKYMKENKYSGKDIASQHRALVEAITKHQPDRAEQVMKEHLRIVDIYIDAMEKQKQERAYD